MKRIFALLMMVSLGAMGAESPSALVCKQMADDQVVKLEVTTFLFKEGEILFQGVNYQPLDPELTKEAGLGMNYWRTVGGDVLYIERHDGNSAEVGVMDEGETITRLYSDCEFLYRENAPHPTVTYSGTVIHERTHLNTFTL